MKLHVFFISLCLVIASNCAIAEKTTLRIGVQAYGTVDWELAALQADPATETADFKLDIQPVANAEAGKIALQAGAVDMIVSDWIWVSRLRSTGADFTFYPYSTASGALIVPNNSPIHSVKDLIGKRLGVAGGELDKNWLLLQALGQQNGITLNTAVEKTFGAPPLINEQLKQNRIDAALTYWHFAARLEAQGYRQLLNGKEILTALGITEDVPAIGYVFKQSWAASHKQALNSFLNASTQAKNRLCHDDAAWAAVIPRTKADDVATQTKLRAGYCQGNVKHWGKPEQQAAERIYTLLRRLSDNSLTGSAEQLQAGTFWSID